MDEYDYANLVFEDDPRMLKEVVLLGCDCHPGVKWNWCEGIHGMDDQHEPFYYMEDEE